MDLRIKHEMTANVVTIRAEDTLDIAYAKMVRHEIRHLPVLDVQGNLVGILSDRDIQRSLKSQISYGGPDGDFRSESCDFDPNTTVADYMTWPVKTLDKDVRLDIAAQRMMNEKISAFLVTENKKIVGILTTDDLLRVLISFLEKPQAGVRMTVNELMRAIA